MKITAEEAYELMEQMDYENYVILDVRDYEDYDQQHIDGAIQVSMDELINFAEREIPSDDTVVFVYSDTEASSALADDLLSEIGLEKVKDIGGIDDWPYDTV